MKVLYTPVSSEDFIHHFQKGNGVYFKGQYGHISKGYGLGSFFLNLTRRALPLIKKYILPHATTALTDTISDIAQGKNVKQSFKQHTIKAGKNILKTAFKRKGSGLNKIKNKKYKKDIFS